MKEVLHGIRQRRGVTSGVEIAMVIVHIYMKVQMRAVGSIIRFLESDWLQFCISYSAPGVPDIRHPRPS